MSTGTLQVCARCVMDSSDPGLRFGEGGTCSHCLAFERFVKPSWEAALNDPWRLHRQVEEIRRSNSKRGFDCILGLSGGLDSSYMLHLMVTEYGLRPLVFHVDGGWNSELSTHNINCLVDALNIDLYTEVINWREMQNFQLACFRAGIPHLDMPQDHAFVATLYRYAEENGVKVILNGGNYATELVLPPKEYYYYGTDMRQIRDILGRFGSVPMNSYPFSSVFRHKVYLRYVKRVRVLKPLNQVRYVQREASSLLQETYGWRPYPQKHFESVFTRFYEGFWLPQRYGFDVRKAQLSSLVITGQMSRVEALEKLNSPTLDNQQIAKDFSFVASKLGISEDELRSYLEMPKFTYRDYRNSSALIELGARLSRMLGIEGAIKL